MDRKWLVGEIANRHGIVLDKDDPVLVTLTLHELLVNEYVEKVTLAVEQAKAQAIVGSAQQVENAKKAAAELLWGAGGYLAEQARRAGDGARRDLDSAVKQNVGRLRAELVAVRRERMLAFWCAVAALLGAVGTAVAAVLR